MSTQAIKKSASNKNRMKNPTGFDMEIYPIPSFHSEFALEKFPKPNRKPDRLPFPSFFKGKLAVKPRGDKLSPVDSESWGAKVEKKAPKLRKNIAPGTISL